MRFLKQFCVIILFSFLGELCRMWLPWPIPASIYGLILLFAALLLKWIPEAAVAEAGTGLVSLLPLLFVAPTVALLDHWSLVAPKIMEVLAVVVISTGVVFFVSGKVTQLLICRKEGKERG